MTRRIPHHLLTSALAVSMFYGLTGVEVQCQQAEARPSLADLQAQIDELRAVPTVVLLDATGSVIGVPWDFPSGENRVFNLEIGLSMSDPTVFGLANDDVFFESARCQGQAYVIGRSSARMLFGPFPVGAAESQYFASGIQLAAVPVSVESVLTGGGCIDEQRDHDDVIRATPYMEPLPFDLPFLQPFYMGFAP